MKKSHRVGAICQILTDAPEKIFSLNYFCEKFSAAKSSISEDINAAKEAVQISETFPARWAASGTFPTFPGKRQKRCRKTSASNFKRKAAF